MEALQFLFIQSFHPFPNLFKKNAQYIIIKLNELILVNVYLPCPSPQDWQDEYMNCLASIAYELSNLEYKHLIIGGDFNMDLNHNHPLRDYLNIFCHDLRIKFVDEKLSGNTIYSFIPPRKGL